MPKAKEKKGNLGLVIAFLSVVIGLIILSFALKAFFVIKDSKFDGVHKFNVFLRGNNETDIVSFSPSAGSISILKLDNFIDNPAESLNVPIDGAISVKGNLNVKNLSSIFIKSEFPFDSVVKNLTSIDLIRLAFFARTVNVNAISVRELSGGLSDSQKNTMVSLSFSDPTIYQENMSVQIVNATNVNVLGAKLASFITNIGGNPILVSSSDIEQKRSKILYDGDISYTVKKLSSYFNIPAEKTDKKGIADVIIVIGDDLSDGSKF